MYINRLKMAALTIKWVLNATQGRKDWEERKENIFWYLHEYTLDGANNPLHGCMLPPWLTSDKLILALKQFQNKKSPGPDGLRPIALKHLPQKCLKLLLMLYTASILLAFTPTAWKGCRMIFIPKPGKDNYKLAKSWRPISLTNYILKALKRVF